MLFQFYWPRVKRDFLCWALYPFLAYIFVIVSQVKTGHSFEWLVGMGLMYLICMGPMLLGRYDYRDISAQLPLSTIEKFSFLFATFFIILPLILEMSLHLSQLLCGEIFGLSVRAGFPDAEKTGLLVGLKIPSPLEPFIISWACISVVLFYVVKSKLKNRTLSGILSFFITLFVLLALSMVTEFIGLQIEKTGLSEDTYISIATTVTIIIYLAISIVYLVKLFKYLRNHGF